jgi:hypothetical protein
MRGFVDLVEEALGSDDELAVSMELVRPERADTAEDLDEVRQLVNSSALDSATGIQFVAHRSPRDGGDGASGVHAVSLHWGQHSTHLFVRGAGQEASEGLRDRAVDALADGEIRPPSDDQAATKTDRAGRPREEVNLDLAAIRFAGTYADVEGLVGDLAGLARQAGDGRLAWVYIELSEPDRTLRLDDVEDLGEITSRDIKKLMQLSVSFQTPSGVALRFTVRQRGLNGSVSGVDAADVRSLRASANDLLHERSRRPRWLQRWMLWSIAAACYSVALGLVAVAPDVWYVSLALGGVALLDAWNWVYLPNVELLRDDEKTRWARWSKAVLGVALAYLLGCLAVPLIPS